MFGLIEKVSVSVAALLIVSLISQKSRKKLTIQKNQYGMERLVAELQHREYASVLDENDEVMEILI